MMKWLLGIVFGLIALAVFAVAKAPASLVPTVLIELEKQQQLPAGAPKLQLVNTSGTVWDGRAEEAVLDIDGAAIPLGVLTWQLSPSSLLRSLPELTLKSQAASHRFSTFLKADPQGVVTMTALEGNFPISMLEPWLPMLVKGEVAFVIDHFVFTPQQILALDGVLNLEYVDWLGGDYDMPLGSYLAQLSLREENVQVQLNDFSASLGIDGLLLIAPSGAYQFNAVLEPRSSLAPEVTETLSWLGKKQENGDVHINKRGRF